jgi:type I restriction enzyme S subunit
MNIGQVALVGTGATPKSGNPKYYQGGHIPWVTSGALNEEEVREGSALVTAAALEDTNCKVFPPETVLLAMYGEGKTRGKCALLRISACTNQAIAAIQCNDQLVRPRYLFRFLQGRYEETRYAAAGGVQPNLNLSIVRAIQLPVPSLEVQDATIAFMDAALATLQRLASHTAGASKLLDRLNEAILLKAFSGELVPQDPDDEPASALFVRIQSERMAAGAPKKRGRGARARL